MPVIQPESRQYGLQTRSTLITCVVLVTKYLEFTFEDSICLNYSIYPFIDFVHGTYVNIHIYVEIIIFMDSKEKTAKNTSTFL